MAATVLVIGLIAGVAVPRYIQARSNQANAVAVENMRKIESTHRIPTTNLVPPAVSMAKTNRLVAPQYPSRKY